MKGWVGLVGWPTVDVWSTKWSSVQLAVRRRTGKVRRSKTSVLPLCYAANQWCWSMCSFDGSPKDLVELSVSLLFGSCFSASRFMGISYLQKTPAFWEHIKTQVCEWCTECDCVQRGFVATQYTSLASLQCHSTLSCWTDTLAVPRSLSRLASASTLSRNSRMTSTLLPTTVSLDHMVSGNK